MPGVSEFPSCKYNFDGKYPDANSDLKGVIKVVSGRQLSDHFVCQN